MNQRTLISILVILLVSVGLSACGTLQSNGNQPTAVIPTPTLDRCSPTNILPEIKKVHDLMRAFDDVSFVANMTPQAQLVNPILKLQDIRRSVENLDLPSCAATLQNDAILYMNAVATTLTHFMGGLQTDMVNKEVSASQQFRVQYETERARLAGVTYMPPATVEPQVAPSDGSSGTPTPAAIMNVTNDGSNPVNLRSSPNVNGNIVGMIQSKKTLPAIGRTETGDWIAVRLPDGVAWVFAKLVKLDKPVEQLPVLSSEPPATGTPTPGS